MLKNFLIVGLGGGIGSMMRYACTLLAQATHISSNWATLFVNAVGSFLIGFCMAYCDKASLLLFFTVGMCGGFTTFSTFSSQSLNLLQTGRYGAGLAYIFGTIILCLLFVWLGCLLGKR